MLNGEVMIDTAARMKTVQPMESITTRSSARPASCYAGKEERRREQDDGEHVVEARWTWVAPINSRASEKLRSSSLGPASEDVSRRLEPGSSRR